MRQIRGGITLTEEGKRIIPYFRSIQANMKWAKEVIQETKTGDFGSIRVGLTPIVATTVLNDAYTWFRSRFKNVKLQFTDGLLTTVTPALKSGKMDYAIALLMDDWRWDKDQIVVEHLFTLTQGFVARKDHPIFQSTNPLQDLSYYEWLITIDSFEEVNDFINECIIPKGISKPKSVILVDTLVCYKLLQSTDCIAVIPTALFNQTQGFEHMKVLDIKKYSSNFSLPKLNLVLLRSPAKPTNHAGEFLMHCIISTIKKYLNVHIL